MPLCKACGARAPDDAKFCPTCGTYFPGGDPTAPASPSAPAPHAPGPPMPGLPAPPMPVPLPLPPATRPLGVTIMSVWNLAFGPVLAMMGAALAVYGPVLLNEPEIRDQLGPQLAQFPPGFVEQALVGVGIMFILLGLAMVGVGYGLFRRTSWAWGSMVALTVTWAVVSLLFFPVGFAGLALAIFLLWYFTRPGVKQHFGRAPEPGLPGYVPPPPPNP